MRFKLYQSLKAFKEEKYIDSQSIIIIKSFNHSNNFSSNNYVGRRTITHLTSQLLCGPGLSSKVGAELGDPTITWLT